MTDSLARFFPGIPADKAKITLHQLMTHSAGFPEVFENDGGDYAKLRKEESPAPFVNPSSMRRAAVRCNRTSA